MDERKAEQISRAMMRARPDDTIRIMSAHDYGAAAVLENHRSRPADRQRSR